MVLAEKIADVFDRYVFGDAFEIHEQFIDWNFFHGLSGLQLSYEDSDENRANYHFGLISSDENEIVLENYHRRSWNPGFGTQTLRVIERGLSLLAQRRETFVRLIFEDCEQQPDTQCWLRKNEYSRRDDGNYEKVFSP